MLQNDWMDDMTFSVPTFSKVYFGIIGAEKTAVNLCAFGAFGWKCADEYTESVIVFLNLLIGM